MGLFDTIYFQCPDCGRDLDAQSKSGPCCLYYFKYDSVPEDVAMDANRHAPFECECGSKWEFINVPKKVKLISLEIQRATDR
jgi:hypothetical protein